MALAAAVDRDELRAGADGESERSKDRPRSSPLAVPAREALAERIVEAAVAEPALLPRAIERAAALAGKDRTTLAALKRGIYAQALAVLEG